MKNKTKHVKHVMAAAAGCILAGLSFPTYAYASDGEDYITISVDAIDDNVNLKYAIDSDDETAFTDSNEFTVPAGTSHTIYVKDAAGNITSQQYEPEENNASYDEEYDDGEEEQRINIDLELGHKKTDEEWYLPDEEGNPGTASVTNRTKTDGTVDAEKVFYTFTTKEGEELYLVVDQGRGSDNVYLLDTVSLGDLRVLADGQDTSSGIGDKKEDNLLSILAEENADSGPEEVQAEKPKHSPFGNGLLMLLLAGIGGGVYYYLKIYRTKKDEAMDAMDAMDMDEFEPEEEEEEVDFDYNDSEKEQFLNNLINEASEEAFFDQNPDEYATSHNDENKEEEESGSEDGDLIDDLEIDF